MDKHSSLARWLRDDFWCLLYVVVVAISFYLKASACQPAVASSQSAHASGCMSGLSIQPTPVALLIPLRLY